MIENELNSITPFIESQFPQHYLTDGPNFIAFVKAFYDWLDQSGNPLDAVRSLPENLDVDTAVDSFVDHFKATYLNGIPGNTELDSAFLIKHIQDLYRSKGTTEGFKLLFRMIYGTDIDVKIPGNDVIRASDGKWVIPIYLECIANQNSASLIGQHITGSSSGASATVESVARRTINGKLIDVIYISNVRGSFVTNEYITANGSFANAPKITGSLTSIAVIDGGLNNSNGTLFSISGPSGAYGQALVTSTINGTGQAQFTLKDGGTGYTLTDTVVTIANSTVITTGNIVSSNTQFTNFVNGETVTQYVYNVSTNTSAYNVGGLVTAMNATSNVIANGIVLSLNGTALQVSSNGSPWTTASKVLLSNNFSVNTTVSAVSDVSRSGAIMAANATAFGIVNVSNTFLSNAYCIGNVSTCIVQSYHVSTGGGASITIGSVSNTETISTPKYDVLGNLNAYGVNTLAMFCDGSNSNGTGYGFSGNNTSGYNNYIANAFSTYTASIGSILTLTIGPGTGYDVPPMVDFNNPFISEYGKLDYAITLASSVGAYAPGYTIQTGDGVSGTILNIDGLGVLHVRRKYFADDPHSSTISFYDPNGTLTGTGVIASIVPDNTSSPMGDNAKVNTTVTSLTGVVSQLLVQDSGLGHQNGDILTLTSQANSSVVIHGIANVSHQGIGLGYWKDNSGKLDADKYIHDNNYYQVFSYEIQSDMSLDRYADMLKKYFHVSGKRLFGKFSKSTVSHNTITSGGSWVSQK